MLGRLLRDVRAVLERDPAARGPLEVILCYPGFHAVQMHRVAHFFYRRRLFTLARVLSQLSRFLTQIEIHPGALIGEGLFIDHGAGVVIGETTVIGNNVTLYQGVTLGGTGKEKGKRHPTIGDNVVISAGAKILGSFEVGTGAKIGAGSVVLKPVAPYSTVVGVPGREKVRDGRRVDDAIDLRHDQLPDPVADTISALVRRIDELEQRLCEMEDRTGTRRAGPV